MTKIQLFFVYLLTFFFRVVRRIIDSDFRLFMLMGVSFLQPSLEKIARMKAYQVYLHAKNKCPAYKKFLRNSGGDSDITLENLSDIPETDKENYVKKFTIEERCYNGRLPSTGVVVDESSGSSGIPNNWVRGMRERRAVKRNIQISYNLTYRKKNFFLLNCFALGPWATGMNVSMSLVDTAILKSIGPEKEKLENTLTLFGEKYHYLVMGYPPFIKNFIDTTSLDLSKYELHLIVGGEGISEGLRKYLLKYFKTIYSSYGASDLEINIGIETDWTINLRRKCLENPELSALLFGRKDPPMIFQYNPADYIVEQSEEGEIVFTIARILNIAPKLRYNIKDMGGSLTFREAGKRLSRMGIDVGSLSERYFSFPLLYVYGRNDLSVPFYGAKIFPSDIEAVLNSDEKLVSRYQSHTLRLIEDKELNKQLNIILELSESAVEGLDNELLRGLFYNKLKEVNQDFREVSKIFTEEDLVVEQYAYSEGPFSDRDIRVKNKYLMDD